MLKNPPAGDVPSSLDQLESEFDKLRAFFAWARDRAAVEIHLALRDRRGLGSGTGSLATMPAAQGELARAVRVFVAADAFYEVAGAVLPTVETDHENRVWPTDHTNLSPRECDVVRLLVEGRTNKEIAATLGIKESTVASYVTNILDKLGLASRTAVAAYAVRHGLV